MGTGVRKGRLSSRQYRANFADIRPLMDPAQAASEAERCYFCHDAPCMNACPTGIDIALFIRKIAAHNATGAAQTILDSNIFGGMCARVCPVETLCEKHCVHVAQGNRPISIGRLQRFATDQAMNQGRVRFDTAPATGKTVAVVGAGPAGLSCAHALARAGHHVAVYEARNKPGGLNEYGLAAYKTVDNFAQREIEFILSFGGIDIHCGQRLGDNLQLDELLARHDALFIGAGLGDVNRLGIKGEELEGVINAVDYIARLRQSKDYASLPVGENAVVVGGGMTAIDIAVQMKKLGSRQVTICYRRGTAQMGASDHERELALTSGVNILTWAAPVAIHGNGAVTGVTFARTRMNRNGELENTGQTFRLAADQVFRAIGQRLDPAGFEKSGIEISHGRIVTGPDGKTSLAGVWAGGDCIAGGDNLTVSAVEDGKRAGAAIDAFLKG